MKKHLALVVEDHPMIARVFENALRAANYQTEVIDDGQAALDRLEEVVPTLVLLDLHLPTVSGDQILRQIRADERLADVKVMVASADGTMASYVEEEADLVFNKPVGFRQLRELAKRLHPDQDDSPKTPRQPQES